MSVFRRRNTCRYRIADLPSGVPVTLVATLNGVAATPTGWSGTAIALNRGVTHDFTFTQWTSSSRPRAVRAITPDATDSSVSRKTTGRTKYEPIALSRGATRDSTFSQWAHLGLGNVHLRSPVSAGMLVPLRLTGVTYYTSTGAPAAFALPQTYISMCELASELDHVSGCLYFPPGTPFDVGGGGGPNEIFHDYQDLDPASCKSGGGVIDSDAQGKMVACDMIYPATAVVYFNPLYDMTFTKRCNAPFSVVSDPRGTVTLSYPAAPFTSGSQPLLCLVWVYLSPRATASPSPRLRLAPLPRVRASAPPRVLPGFDRPW